VLSKLLFGAHQHLQLELLLISWLCWVLTLLQPQRAVVVLDFFVDSSAVSSLVRAWLCSKFVSVQHVSPLAVSGILFWQLAALIFRSTIEGVL
jgi:hypothetical protein